MREHFEQLKSNIESTPVILRQILGHPILPGEDYYAKEYSVMNPEINFTNNEISEFSLKYLAKFINEKRVEQLAIRGGLMPMNQIKIDDIVLLNLSKSNLFSEDIFILSQVLYDNKSITHINLNGNNIGLNKN